jgi:hypothetical protein
MMTFWNQHPRLGGAVLGGVVVTAVGVAAFVLRAGCMRSSELVAEQPQRAAPAGDHAGHGTQSPTTPGTTKSPAGFAPVALDPTQATAMGLTSALVTERDFTRRIRTVGVITVDETRTAHVHTRVRGWIEGFHVQYVGRTVRAGETLVSIYSQEVYAAQLELASLLRATVRSPDLLDAARRRFSLWDIPRSVVAKVEQTGEPQRTFPVLAPRSGVVVAKQAFDGLFVDPSLELYTISDLSRVWVLADVYEADVAQVGVGSVARLTVEGRRAPVTAKVGFLYPTIDRRDDAHAQGSLRAREPRRLVAAGRVRDRRARARLRSRAGDSGIRRDPDRRALDRVRAPRRARRTARGHGRPQRRRSLPRRRGTRGRRTRRDRRAVPARLREPPARDERTGRRPCWTLSPGAA